MLEKFFQALPGPLFFFFFVGFVFCDSYYPIDRGGQHRWRGPERGGQHGQGRTGRGGLARARGGHGQRRIKRGGDTGGEGPGGVGGTGEEGPSGGKLDECIMHQVHTSFSWCFQYVFQVPIVFPNTFSRAPHFYPIWFGKCCPSFIYLYY